MTGDSSLVVAVAGLVIKVIIPCHDWAAVLAERYHAFASGEEAGWCVTVRPDASQPFEGRGWARHNEGVTDFHVYWYRGEIDLETGTAWVTAPSLERLPSALERTLTYILMQALPREQHALLLHACGVEIDGCGYAFFGPSGAGKTTVARLAQGHGEVLGDENVVLRLTGDEVELASTPFWGSSTPPEIIHRANRSAPLAGLYSLAHASRFAVARLTPGQGVAALLKTEKVATERVESAAAWLAVAGSIVERVPVHLLRFAPSKELWSFLMRHGSDASPCDGADT